MACPTAVHVLASTVHQVHSVRAFPVARPSQFYSLPRISLPVHTTCSYPLTWQTTAEPAGLQWVLLLPGCSTTVSSCFCCLQSFLCMVYSLVVVTSLCVNERKRIQARYSVAASCFSCLLQHRACLSPGAGLWGDREADAGNSSRCSGE